MIDTIALIIGFIAMATVVLSFQVKDPRGTLWVMAAATGLFAIHFGLLGAVTGCILNVLNVLRNVVILYTDPQKLSGKFAMHLFAWAYMAAPVVFSLFPSLNIGIPDYILGAIMMICAYLFWTRREGYIRAGQFFLISPGWIWYNYLSSSIPGIVTECLNLTSVAVYYLRKLFAKSKKTNA